MPRLRPLAGLALATLAPVLGGLVLGACEPKQQTLAATPPPSITGRVRVLDADVLIIDGKHIKLSNAYAPESLLHAR